MGCTSSTWSIEAGVARALRPRLDLPRQMATDLQIAIRKFTSVNPATGEVMREFEPASEAEVIAAVARARAAQPAWYGLGVQQADRSSRQLSRTPSPKKSEVARLITHEAGKPQVEALLTEVMVVLDAARFYSENSYAFLRDQALPHGNLAMKTKVRTPGTRALWGDRNHFSVELSVFHSGH